MAAILRSSQWQSSFLIGNLMRQHPISSYDQTLYDAGLSKHQVADSRVYMNVLGASIHAHIHDCFHEIRVRAVGLRYT